VLWGPHLLCVVLGAHRRAWVEVLGARRIVHGWWWCALVSLFLGGGGGGGAPSSVFMHHVVLSPFEGEGGGWLFVFVGAPSVVVVGVVLHHFCVPSHVVLVACPQHCVSSASCVLIVIVCPCHVVVSCPPRHCPVLLSLLCPHCDVSFGCMMWHLC